MFKHSFLVLQLIVFVSGQPNSTIANVRANAVREFIDSNNSTHYESTRAKRTTDHIITGKEDCMRVATTEGHYFYKSSNNEEKVCGIYFVTDFDQTIEIYFSYLDVPCENSGLVVFIDGWELNGEFFPGLKDHPKSIENRFSEFCGKKKPKKVFRTSQNAGLIQYKVPKKGAGFSFTVRFLKNRKPCNVLLQDTAGIYTLRNYGKRNNCSISAIFPAVSRILSINIGLVGIKNRIELETGTIHKCQKRGLEDYVQIGGSDGLDNEHLYVTESLCGIDSKPGRDEHIIFCGVTTVRLVSSGIYDNSVTVLLRKAQDEDITPAATICPLPDY